MLILTGKGVVEGNSLVKHNFNFRETANFLNNKLTVDANINAMYQRGNEPYYLRCYYMNPLVGLYHFRVVVLKVERTLTTTKIIIRFLMPVVT